MKKLLALVLMICGLGLGFFGIPSFLGDNAWNDVMSKVKSGDEGAVTEKVTEIAEWSVLDFKYSNATNYSDSLTIDKLKKKIKVPFTSKQIVMMYDGDIKIGVDAEKITVDVEKSGSTVNSITVGIPPMMITANDIDRDSIRYPLEKNNILNDIDSDDYAQMEEEGKAKMAEAVNQNGAMDRAKEELKTAITGYLTALYGEDVKINFVDAN